MSLFYVALSPRSRRYIFFFGVIYRMEMMRFAVWKLPLGIALWKLLFQSRQFALSEKWNENPRSGNAIVHFWRKNTLLLLLLSRASLENIFRTRGYLRRRFDLGTLVPALTFFLFFFSFRKRVTTTCDLPICSFFFYFYFFFTWKICTRRLTIM